MSAMLNTKLDINNIVNDNTINTSKLKSDTLKTINGESVIGKGDILIDSVKSAEIATDLSGHNEATEEIIAYRPSAGNKSIKDDSAVIKNIYGNSLVYNQLFNIIARTSTINGCTIKAENNKIRITGTPTNVVHYGLNGFAPNFSHKYFISGCPSGGSAYPGGYMLFDQGRCVELGEGAIWTPQEYWNQTDFVVVIRIGTDWIGKEIDLTFEPFMIDLTQEFGAGNEPTTVEEYYQRTVINKETSEVNTGEIIDTVYGVIETTGLNQWDEQWELGIYDTTTGEGVIKSTAIRSKNSIKVFSNAKYYCRFIKGTNVLARIFFYDDNDNFISWQYVNNAQFTTPTSCNFIRFDMTEAYGATYKNDICINLSHTGIRDGEYEPYKKSTHDLSWIMKYFVNGMRSAGSNVRDEIRFNETTQKWEAVQRVGVVDLGSLNWVYIDGYKSFRTTDVTDSKYISAYPYGEHLNQTNANGYIADEKGVYGVDKSISVNYAAHTKNSILIRDDAYSTVETFKTEMSGVMLNYELAEPIITEITELVDMNYTVYDFGTEEFIIDVVSTPFVGNIIYQFNAVDRIRDNERNINSYETDNIFNC